MAVGQKGIYFSRRGNDPHRIERNPAQKGVIVCQRRGTNTGRVEGGVHKMIDLVVRGELRMSGRDDHWRQLTKLAASQFAPLGPVLISGARRLTAIGCVERLQLLAGIGRKRVPACLSKRNGLAPRGEDLERLPFAAQGYADFASLRSQLLAADNRFEPEAMDTLRDGKLNRLLLMAGAERPQVGIGSLVDHRHRFVTIAVALEKLRFGDGLAVEKKPCSVARSEQQGILAGGQL